MTLYTIPEDALPCPPTVSSYPSRGSSFSDLPYTFRSDDDSHSLSSDEGPPREAHDMRAAKIWEGYYASYPARQFALQLRNLLAQRSGTSPFISCEVTPEPTRSEIECIRNRWIDQGIWRPEWKQMPDPDSQWLHEDKQPYSIFVYNNAPESGQQTKKETPAKRAKRVQAMQKADASRPFYQFMNQVSTQREYMQHHFESGDKQPEYMPERFKLEASLAEKHSVHKEEDDDIEEEIYHVGPGGKSTLNSMAYEIVRLRWKWWGIWDPTWIHMPGMTWQHEMPIEIFARLQWNQDLGDQIMAIEREVREAEEEQRLQEAQEKKLQAILKESRLSMTLRSREKTTKAEKPNTTKVTKPKSKPARQTHSAKSKAVAEPQGRASSPLAKRSAPTSEDESEEEPSPKRTRRQ